MAAIAGLLAVISGGKILTACRPAGTKALAVTPEMAVDTKVAEVAGNDPAATGTPNAVMPPGTAETNGGAAREAAASDPVPMAAASGKYCDRSSPELKVPEKVNIYCKCFRFYTEMK